MWSKTFNKYFFVDCAREIHLSHVKITTNQTSIHLYVSVTYSFHKPKNLKPLRFHPQNTSNPKCIGSTRENSKNRSSFSDSYAIYN